MAIIKEQIIQDIDNLSDVDLMQVAKYVTFLRFQARISTTPMLDEAQMASLYADFADEDSELAEECMMDYTTGLMKEDIK